MLIVSSSKKEEEKKVKSPPWWNEFAHRFHSGEQMTPYSRGDAKF